MKQTTVKTLCELDENDEDQLDKFSKQKERMMNLVATLCALYDQRNTPSNISLNGNHLSSCFTELLNNYKTVYDVYMDLPEPETDEEFRQIDIHTKMLTIYAQHLYVFMEKQKKAFEKDQLLMGFVTRIKDEVATTVMDDYLISRFNTLFPDLA